MRRICSFILSKYDRECHSSLVWKHQYITQRRQGKHKTKGQTSYRVCVLNVTFFNSQHSEIYIVVNEMLEEENQIWFILCHVLILDVGILLLAHSCNISQNKFSDTHNWEYLFFYCLFPSKTFLYYTKSVKTSHFNFTKCLFVLNLFPSNSVFITLHVIYSNGYLF